MSDRTAPTTILEASEAIRTGELAPLDLVEQCLERIARFEPQVRAWVLVDEEGARRQAQRQAVEIAAGGWRGPLHGVPIAIKDIVDVEGFPTLAGSRIREGHVATEDATVVARLRAAGAIILGKTVTTEWASFDPSVTRNPWNLERTPGGSSSGSAAAVALGMAFGAVGSQTGGSISRPASYCGVAGCKPTYGRVSVRGFVPLAFSMDHPGPFAHRVRDLAVLLQAMAGPDDADPFTSFEPVTEYLEYIEEYVNMADDPPRIGWIEQYFMDESQPSVREATESAVHELREVGAQVVPVPNLEGFADINRWHRRIMAVEAAEFHRTTFTQRRQDYGPAIAALIEEGLALTATDYAEAKRQQVLFQHRLRAALDDRDVLLTPATPTPALGLETTGDPKFNSPWSYSGLPTVSIPCAVSPDGMPLAIQLTGRAFEDGHLLAVAAWCESVLKFDAVPPLLR